MNAFFVRHPLEPQESSIPGRVPYQVSAMSLVREVDTYKREQFDGTIFADGFGENRPGPNVDPNVFSELIPWFHAFCQISSQSAPYHIAECGAGLSECVAQGDLVFYGGAISTNMLFVDTVLCVERTVLLPQRDGRFQVKERVQELLTKLELDMSPQSFLDSRTYRLNLRDAEADGRHSKTELDPHRILIGRRLAAHDLPHADSATLLELFCTGLGFNFIPVCFAAPSKNKSVRVRPGLFVSRFPDANRMLHRKLCVMTVDQTTSLLRSIFAASDRLVLDPVVPTSSLARAG